MPYLRELNNHNTAKKNGYFLGHSDNLITLSLSLSQALAYKRDNTPLILCAGRPRQYTAFLVFTQEKSACFFVPVGHGGVRGRYMETNIYLLTISLII